MKKIIKKFKKLINKNNSSGINLLILSFVAVLIKLYCVYFSYKNLSTYGTDYYLNSFCTDLIVILIILGLTTINHFIKKRGIKIFNNIISFIIFLIFCIDIFTIYFLQSRIAIFEAFQYISSGGIGFTLVVLVTIIIIGILRAILLMCTRNIKKESKITKYILLSLRFFVCGITITQSKPKDIKNIISLNINYVTDIFTQGGSDRLENNTTEEEKPIEYQDYLKYVNGDGKDVNIILVFAESLSAIDSNRVGGNNNLEKFDEIQKDGITFTNFIANGSTSDSCHLSTLLGIIPLSGIGVQESPYTGYKTRDAPLAEFLNKQGYMTTFISAATLEFLKQRDFISFVGFKKIIGEEEFKDKKKYAFDAAPDEDLFNRTIEEVKNQTGKFFIGLQTISFHRPFNSPYGKTEEEALSYSEDSLYNFYNQLKEIGYFDSGILIIVGDHRKPTPAETNEENLLGRYRYGRAVATIIGTGIEAGTYNNNIIQHTDIYNSLKKLVGAGKIKVSSKYNDIFSNKTNRDRGIISRPYHEDKYTITFGKSNGFIFNNLSSLKQINTEIYKYFLSYTKYQYGDDKIGNTILIGHKGVPEYAPENSIKSFILANKLGAKGVEFDISYTKDHVNIVTHGQYLKDSNCDDKKVGDYTYERITENCTLNDGEQFNTLRNTLSMIDGLFDYYFLEIKVYDESYGVQQTLNAIQTVKDLNMQDRVIFISYSTIAREVLKAQNDIIFGRDTYDVADLDFIGNNNSKYFLAPYESIDKDVVEKAREIGKEVVTYTVNDTGTFQKMKDLGINIILTDNIKLLKDYENEQ